MSDLSVVIPTVGRAAELRRVLDGLARQDASSFDVVVACDAMHAGLDEVRASLVHRPYQAQIVQAELPGASAARNAGIGATSSPLILFLDDDVVPRRELIREHLARHAQIQMSTIAVLGAVVWAPGMRITPFMRWLERGIQFDFAGIVGEEAGWERFYTANVSVSREMVEAVGGFDEVRLPYGYEDLDLAKRMHDERGLRVLFNPRAVGEHLHVMTLDSWRANAARIAPTERAFIAKHPDTKPYFHDLFLRASERPPARGRGRHLAWLIHRPSGWLGSRVWRSADLWFRQQLAPHFLDAWDAAEDADDG